MNERVEKVQVRWNKLVERKSKELDIERGTG
jgi:hypothetical protein